MLTISASVCVCTDVCTRVCVHVCVRISERGRLGGERSCQTSPTVSPGTILCGLICEGRTAPAARALCYSCVLISSAFRPYLDPVCFFSLLLICSQAGEGGTACLTKTENCSKPLVRDLIYCREQLKNLSFRDLFLFFFYFGRIHVALWFLCQMSESCHLPERARDFFLYIISFFFLSFVLPSSDSCGERPGWHGLGGFSGTQAEFDWRLARRLRPRRESATPGASMHAHAPDCNIVMATEAK